MRMRTIDQVAVYVKDIDPDTALTKTAIRRLVVTGQLPSISVGAKYLIALENVDEFLHGGPPVAVQQVGEIRPVSVGR